MCSARAAEFEVKVAEKEPPAKVGETIKQVLQAKAVQVLEEGKPVFQFWLRSETPVKNAPESESSALKALDEVSLIGVAAVGEGRRDYKDSEIPAGTYTMRFGLQPQDGDHLGTSDYPYFLVLIPVASDAELDAITKYRPMVRASSKAAPSGHPIVLSLRPASGEASKTPEITTPANEHKAVRLELPVKAAGSAEGAKIPFDLVVEGRYAG